MATTAPRGKGARGTAKGSTSRRTTAGSTKKSATAKKAASKKSAAKKAAARKTARKTARKPTAKSAAASRARVKKSVSKKGPAKKTAKKKAIGKTASKATRKAPMKAAKPKQKAPPTPPETSGQPERLHKFLASTGAGSRRECETFIAQGRVTVNGKVVTKMGVKVDPATDAVTLDGEKVKPEGRVYYLLNKPSGYICTNADERGRPRATDLIKDERRIYTVGRLDADSTGLVLLTNDGGIANVVCHPRYRIEKVYQVHVRGDVTRAQIAQVEAGVWLAEGKSSPALVKPLGRNPKRGETVLEMTLYEGRNREIRRVLAKVGLVVRRLQRTAIGPLTLGSLAPGAFARLGPEDLTFVHEAEQLYLANQTAWDAELPRPEPRRRARGGTSRTGSKDVDRRRTPTRKGGGDKSQTGWGVSPFPKRGRRRSDVTGERGDARGGGGRDGDAAGRRRRRRPS